LDEFNRPPFRQAGNEFHRHIGIADHHLVIHAELCRFMSRDFDVVLEQLPPRIGAWEQRQIK
jgi:hypothetical protein